MPPFETMASNPTRVQKKSKSQKKEARRTFSSSSQQVGYLVHERKQEGWLQDDLSCEECENFEVFELGMVLSIGIQLSQHARSTGSIKVCADERNILPKVGKSLLHMC